MPSVCGTETAPGGRQGMRWWQCCSGASATATPPAKAPGSRPPSPLSQPLLAISTAFQEDFRGGSRV
eukprot:1987531-Rhodomonas_salina.1